MLCSVVKHNQFVHRNHRQMEIRCLCLFYLDRDRKSCMAFRRLHALVRPCRQVTEAEAVSLSAVVWPVCAAWTVSAGDALVLACLLHLWPLVDPLSLCKGINEDHDTHDHRQVWPLLLEQSRCAFCPAQHHVKVHVTCVASSCNSHHGVLLQVLRSSCALPEATLPSA